MTRLHQVDDPDLVLRRHAAEHGAAAQRVLEDSGIGQDGKFGTRDHAELAVTLEPGLAGNPTGNFLGILN